MNPTYTIPTGTRIGHVHLKVSNLQRALDFYCGLLGFELMQMYGDAAAFISAGGYHHHIGLNTWYSNNARRRNNGRSAYFIRPFSFRKEQTLLLLSSAY